MPNPLTLLWTQSGCFRASLALSLLGWMAQAAPPLQAGTLVQFRTVLGDIEVNLMDRDKPATVNNFVGYITNGYYQNVFLHRCVPGFVVQGGEFITLNRASSSLFLPENIYTWPNLPPVTNEFSVGPRVSNTYGTIAMARVGGQTNSATSQWFFNLADNTALDSVDGGFTVFGRVVGGTNVLNAFNLLGLGSGIVDLQAWYPGTSFGALFNSLPVTYQGTAYPKLNDLIYVDITLLRVQVQRGPGPERIIRWRSILNRTNRVEFTETMPPLWNTLAVSNGTGLTMEVSDTSTHSPFRFYRVRVDY